MNTGFVARATGLAGVAIGVGSIILMPLYFMYSGAPPAANVITRNLINIVVCSLLVFFVSGLAYLIRKANPAYEWIASVVYAAGITYVAVILIGVSLEVGGIFAGPDGTIDPTRDGALAHGAILIHGSVGRALTVIFLGAAGYGLRKTRILPQWLGTAAYAIAIVNLAFIPSMYFGPDPSHFYSAVGWGNAALVASLVVYWALAVGIALLRSRRGFSLAAAAAAGVFIG